MLLKILILIIVVFISGCDRINKVLYKDAFEENKVSSSAQDSGKTSGKNIAGENSDTVLRLFEGLIKINSTERSFKDCNNPDSLYYIKDETGALSANFKKIFPSENIYASAIASVKGYTSDSVKNLWKGKTLGIPASHMTSGVLATNRTGHCRSRKAKT